MPPSVKPSHVSRRKNVHSDAINSPSDHQSKRCKRAHSPDEVDEPVESGDDYVVSQVTQHLKTQPAQATKDHANIIHETNRNGVKAYAKVAAHDWTFYITKLSVNIGRAPETASADHDLVEETRIHIDLGPSKMVSRDHASISFDPKDEKWLLHVKGRNGAKLDGQVLRPHALRYLTSGQVIEIGNVEMIFVLPSEISPLYVHSMFLRRCNLDPSLSSQLSALRRQTFAPTLPYYTWPGTPTPTQGNAYSSGTKSSAGTNASLKVANCADLSHDENKHIKPQYSYAQMITQAIINAPDRKLNLNGIYTFIMENYSYYRHQQAAGWQNSIRHNLSLNKSFEKVARSNDELGKGMKWQIVPEARDDMVRNAYKLGRGGHRGSSTPNSPSHFNCISHDPRDITLPSPRKPHGSPLASLPLVSLSSRLPLQDAQSSPERDCDRGGSRTTVLTVDGSPFPRHDKRNFSADRDSSLSNFNNQSPTLTSSYLQEDGLSLVTPAPPRIHPKLVPPSTAQRPSQHMPTSSPAPFWKYAEIGSTPLRPSAQYEMSPSKAAGRIQSESSSPRGACKSLPISPSRPHKHETSLERTYADDTTEEQGIDLTKGFQTISSYHAPVSRGICIASAL